MNKKIIKNALIVFTIFILMVSTVIAQDEHHLETCHDDYCIYCLIIHIAQNIINLSIVFILAINLGFLMYAYLSKLQKENRIYLQLSLIFQKVQLNE